MSPLPSPTPLRRSIARVMFSPLGLLFGFVVLIMITCPGARGDDAISSLLANGGLEAGRHPANLADLPVVATRTTWRSTDRSTTRDRAPISAARSKTPAERALESARNPLVDPSADGVEEPATLPLVSDPLAIGGTRASAAALVPMTGPAVGIRPRLPRTGR